MEYADNGDLFQKISDYKANEKQFEENEIWSIFIHIVKGLKSLHDLKILHRDIKVIIYILTINHYIDSKYISI